MPVSKRYFLGVDPGKSGGFARIDAKGKIIDYYPMPPFEDTIAFCKLFENLTEDVEHAFLEQVSSRPGEGHVGAFTFGRCYGRLEIGLAYSGIPYELSTPRSWQSTLKIKSKDRAESRPQFKVRLCATAKKLFPKLPLWDGTKKAQLAVCDAILMAEACRRSKLGIR